MKFSPRTFRAEWDLHAWSGVIASLFLFVMFFSGVFALFHEELHAWQDPRSRGEPTAALAPVDFEALFAWVKAHGEPAVGSHVGVYAEADSHLAYGWMSDEKTGAEENWAWNRVTGETVPEITRVADELYYLHFFHRVPGGLEFSGVLGVLLLVATVTGVVIHLKDLKRQFWQFRSEMRARYSGSDAHKVLGIFGLPFVIVLGWSGVLLCLSTIVGGAFTWAAYDGKPEKIEELRSGGVPARFPSGQPAPAFSANELARRAQRAAEADELPVTLNVSGFGDEVSTVYAHFDRHGFEPERGVVLDGRTGEVLRSESKSEPVPGAAFERLLFDLHFAHFGGVFTKFVYAALAFAFCAVVVTGNIIWLERRDRERARLGNRILERLTLGVCAGLCVATATYFLANRLLPLDLNARGSVEFGVFLAVWAVAAVIPFFLWKGARQTTRGYAWVAAAFYLLVIVVDFAVESVHLGSFFTRALSKHESEALVFELVIAILGLGSAAVALAQRRSTSPSSSSRSLSSVLPPASA